MILNSLGVIATCCAFLYWIFKQFSKSIIVDIHRLSTDLQEVRDEMKAFKVELIDQRKRTDQLFEILINKFSK